MPRGNWRYVFGGFVLLETILFAFFFYDSGRFSGANDRESQGYAQHYAAIADYDIRRSCTISTKYAECVRQIVEATHEHQRGEANLDWQRQSAKWAWWAVVVALGQGLVGAWGLWALFRTIRQGEAGLQAARDAVSETRRIGEAQVRAYLRIESVWVKRDRFGFLWFSPNFSNCGQSPAFYIRARYDLSLLHTTSSTIIEEHGQWTGWNEVIPAQCKEFEAVAWCCPRRTNDIIAQLWESDKELSVSIKVEVTARDVFKRKIDAFGYFTTFACDWEVGKFYKMGESGHVSSAIRGEIAGRKSEKQNRKN